MHAHFHLFDAVLLFLYFLATASVSALLSDSPTEQGRTSADKIRGILAPEIRSPRSPPSRLVISSPVQADSLTKDDADFLSYLEGFQRQAQSLTASLNTLA